MRSGAGRAALIGVLMALLVAAVVAALAFTGVLPALLESSVPKRVLVIVAAPDGEGAIVASYGFVLDPELTRPVVLDMRAEGSIQGTSARTPRTALPFGGGSVVSRAVSEQTGGEPLEWILVKPEVWKPMVDAEGGLAATVPSDISTYRSGTLTVLPAGRAKLTGEEIAALAAASDFMSEEQADVVFRELGDGLSGAIVRNADELAELADADVVTSSLSINQLRRLLASVER